MIEPPWAVGNVLSETRNVPGISVSVGKTEQVNGLQPVILHKASSRFPDSEPTTLKVTTSDPWPQSSRPDPLISRQRRCPRPDRRGLNVSTRRMQRQRDVGNVGHQQHEAAMLAMVCASTPAAALAPDKSNKVRCDEPKLNRPSRKHGRRRTACSQNLAAESAAPALLSPASAHQNPCRLP